LFSRRGDALLEKVFTTLHDDQREEIRYLRARTRELEERILTMVRDGYRMGPADPAMRRVAESHEAPKDPPVIPEIEAMLGGDDPLVDILSGEYEQADSEEERHEIVAGTDPRMIL